MLEQLTALAESAAQHWPMICGKPELVMHRENTVFKVQTRNGAAALRLHREGYHSATALQSELDWMAMLDAAGFELPRPLPTIAGNYLADLSSGINLTRKADLLTWVDGKPLGASFVPLAFPRDQLAIIFENIGQRLARLHLLSDAWSPPVTFTRPRWDIDGLLGDDPFWGPFWSISGITDDERDVLFAIRDTTRRDLTAYVQNGADFGLIHADLARENILVLGSNVRFIDYDDSGFGYRVFDIATALIKNRREPDYPRLVDCLFEGYEKHRAISFASKASLRLFMVLRSLTYLGWAEARKYEPGMAPRRAHMIEEALALSRAYLSGF
jgi:Ser/Thr protein kinase RdoA (MazF antagonist)